MRGRQRAVLGASGGDRQPARQRRPAHRADRPETPASDRRQVRRHRPRVSDFAAGDRRHRRDRRRLLPRVRRTDAVRRPRRSCSRRCSRATPSSTSPRRCGSPASTSARSPRSSPLGGNSQDAASSRWTSTPTACRSMPTRPRRSATRIFLEGNFYVDLHPGTPSAPILHSGATLPAANTAGPVQLDRVLSALTAERPGQPPDARAGASARRSIDAADAPRRTPPNQDPSVRGLTGAQALNAVARVLRGRVQGIGDRQPGAARNPAARSERMPYRATRRCSGPWPRARPSWRASSTTFDADDGDARLAPERAERLDRRAAAAAAHHATRADLAERLVRPDPDVRQGDPARASSSSIRRSARRCRGSRRRRRWSRRASSAAWSRT